MALIHNLKKSSSPLILKTSKQSSSNEHQEFSAPATLNIIIKPVNKIRFRYGTEKGSHGVLAGVKSDSTKSKKDYPTIKLENYNGNKSVKIKVSLYTHDENKEHVLDLICKCCKDGACEKILGKDLTAAFQVYIQNKKRSEVFDILMNRRKQNRSSYHNEKIVKAEVEKEAKNINLNTAKLCFEAFEEKTGNFICRTFSDVIKNSKNSETGDLKICHLSKDVGSCQGGEEITLLCDKVKKENIKVHFYEEDEFGDIVWQDNGVYSKSNWHHQVALVFKTPPYKDNIKKQVYIELVRESDGSCSEAKKFTYLPYETGVLKIRHLSKVTGSIKGGEEIIFLCDKVQKENIQVRFFEEELGNVKWEAFGTFSEVDWHHEVALVCKTPPYKDDIGKQVYIELVRITDNSRSEARKFFYISPETDVIKRKRPKLKENKQVVKDGMLREKQGDMDYNNDDFDIGFPESKPGDNVADILESMDFKDGFLIDDRFLNMCDPVDSDYSASNLDLDYWQSMENEVTTDSILDNSSEKFSPSPKQNTSDKKSKMFPTNATKHDLKKSLKYKFVSQAIINFLSNNMEPFFEFAFHVMPLQNEKGNNLLHMIVINQSDNLCLVSKLLNYRPSCVKIQNKKKQTALHLAALGNNIPLLKLLLAHGANPSSQDKEGDTCFHIVCRSSSAELLKELLSVTQNKEELSIKNYEGLAPLHICVLQEAVKCLHLLADARANLNVAEEKSGKTALHFAIEIASPNILEFLLCQAEIDKNSKDFSGRTFIQYAEAINRKDLVENLTIFCDITSDSSKEFHDENSTSSVETSLRALSFSMEEDETEEAREDLIQFLDNSLIKEICKLLDPPSDGWCKFGVCLVDDFKPNSILRLKCESPTKELLKYLQRHYPENPLDTLKTMLSLADLHDAFSLL